VTTTIKEAPTGIAPEAAISRFRSFVPSARVHELNELLVQALQLLEEHDLKGLHARQVSKLADLQHVREKEVEQARHVRELELEQEALELDAVAELESQEGFVPGKNEEARRRQRKAWLGEHFRYQQQCQVVRTAEAKQDRLALEKERIAGDLAGLKSLIGIRITELRTIAAFVGR